MDQQLTCLEVQVVFWLLVTQLIHVCLASYGGYPSLGNCYDYVLWSTRVGRATSAIGQAT